MKKILIIICTFLLLCGCGKNNEKNVIQNLTKKINNSNSYYLEGMLEIYRNEEKYSYNVISSYQKGDLFKVELINQNNNHKQIILKNTDGVYVITPSLNKSFKFQSDWPYNNSQVYLLQPITNDVKNDSKTIIETTKDGYILTSNVNYSTEKDYKYQKVYVDQNLDISKVEVYDSKDNVTMCLTITNIDYNATFDDNYFDESKYKSKNDSENTNEESNDELNQNEQKNTSKEIDEIVYPMYVPVDTYLSGQDIVETKSGERVILTFNGESSFTIVQETLSNDELTNYVYGDPYLIIDTVGSITDYSVSWISDGVEYSVMSDTMNVDELLTVAQSIAVKAVGK